MPRTTSKLPKRLVTWCSSTVAMDSHESIKVTVLLKTGHRLQVSVRLMRPDSDGRLRPAAVDMPFELTLCA